MEESKKTANHGGARKGAGRPRGEPRVMRQFWLGEKEIAVLDSIPKGKRSAYVGRAILFLEWHKT